MIVDPLIKDSPEIWKPSVSNEVGRLVQDVRDIVGNNVLGFIQNKQKYQRQRKSHMRE